MIEFETPKPIQMLNTALETVAVNMMRPKSRYFDEHEHEIPWDYINFMHMAMRQTGAGSLAPAERRRRKMPQGKNARASVTSSWLLPWRCYPGATAGCTW